jgi:hypothetical protein
MVHAYTQLQCSMAAESKMTFSAQRSSCNIALQCPQY